MGLSAPVLMGQPFLTMRSIIGTACSALIIMRSPPPISSGAARLRNRAETDKCLNAKREECSKNLEQSTDEGVSFSLSPKKVA